MIKLPSKPQNRDPSQRHKSIEAETNVLQVKVETMRMVDTSGKYYARHHGLGSSNREPIQIALRTSGAPMPTVWKHFGNRIHLTCRDAGRTEPIEKVRDKRTNGHLVRTFRRNRIGIWICEELDHAPSVFYALKLLVVCLFVADSRKGDGGVGEADLYTCTTGTKHTENLEDCKQG